MNNEDKYNAALERAKKELQACGSQDCDAARQIFRLFPELSGDEDERIRKELIRIFKGEISYTSKEDTDKYIAWLEKQKPINEEELKNGALKYVARQFMNWLDKEIPEDEMCLSNAECKVIEDAFLREDWTSISRYMQEKLEKQGEQPDDNKLKFQKIKEEGYKYEQSIFMHHQERCRSRCFMGTCK